MILFVANLVFNDDVIRALRDFRMREQLAYPSRYDIFILFTGRCYYMYIDMYMCGRNGQ